MIKKNWEGVERRVESGTKKSCLVGWLVDGMEWIGFNYLM
jgi:hypothetical protein